MSRSYYILFTPYMDTTHRQNSIIVIPIRSLSCCPVLLWFTNLHVVICPSLYLCRTWLQVPLQSPERLLIQRSGCFKLWCVCGASIWKSYIMRFTYLLSLCQQTIRRLAQNREAARKSRLRKKVMFWAWSALLGNLKSFPAVTFSQIPKFLTVNFVNVP